MVSPAPNIRLFVNHYYPDNHITWYDFEAREITGQIPIPMRVGDYFQCRMSSGQDAIFRVKEIEFAGQTFFAHVEGIGYKDEIDLAGVEYVS